MGKRIFSPSAVALLGVFGLAAYGGANMVMFEQLSRQVWLGAVDEEPVNSALDSVAVWANTAGVETAARALMLEIVVAQSPQDNAGIESAMIELAAVAPTSTATWQSMAEIRKARGEPMESVLAAFRMSALTGSHEGYFMMQRALFGLEHWNELPDADRGTVIRDIAGSVGPANGAPGFRYRRLLATKSEAERENIRSALLASGLATKDLRQALGL